MVLVSSDATKNAHVTNAACPQNLEDLFAVASESTTQFGFSLKAEKSRHFWLRPADGEGDFPLCQACSDTGSDGVDKETA